MKMSKIESARIIAQSTDNPVCRSILCSSCFNSRKGKTCKDGNLMAIEKAKAYIKRHESKSKKKNHIRDTTKKVDSTAVSYEPCVSCRNNHGLCSTKERTANVKNCVSYDPIIKKKVEPKPVEEPVKKWVKCVNNENGLLPLIIGKTYKVIFHRIAFICVLDEDGNERAFNERRFEPVEEPTPLEIAKMIRDNGYSCLGLIKNCPPCPLWGKGGCGTSDKIVEENHIKRKQLIDNYISANEPKPVKTVGIDNDDVTFARPTVKENLSVPCKHLINGDACGNPFDHCDKDCPANSEYPQPIKLPDFVYYASKNGVGFIDTKNRTFNTNDKGELLINDKPCFATPEEALQVAKKLWNGEKK